MTAEYLFVWVRDSLLQLLMRMFRIGKEELHDTFSSFDLNGFEPFGELEVRLLRTPRCMKPEGGQLW